VKSLFFQSDLSPNFLSLTFHDAIKVVQLEQNQENLKNPRKESNSLLAEVEGQPGGQREREKAFKRHVISLLSLLPQSFLCRQFDALERKRSKEREKNNLIISSFSLSLSYRLRVIDLRKRREKENSN
jgi:hypothetical protein